MAEQPTGEVATEVVVAERTDTSAEPQLPALVLEPPGAEVMPPSFAPQVPAPTASTPVPEKWGSYAPPAVEDAEAGQHAVAALERVTARIRAGTLVVPGLNASVSEPAALAAVLASMLRQQH